MNSLLIGDELIVPDPLGPVVDGKDVLLQAVKDRLEPLGCRVRPVDNFYPYRRYGGEVHCGTNATRHPADFHSERMTDLSFKRSSGFDAVG